MVRAVQRFGGQHTELKLRVLTEYLEAYLSVMQKQDFFRLTYIDALAGTGWSRAALREDDRQTDFLDPVAPTKGSALRVFDVKNKGRRFDRYVFNDLRKGKLKQLRNEVEGLFPAPVSRPEMQFTSDTADQVIARECDRLEGHDRAVMFLDPFGMQVSWQSIQRVAASRQIDLWYLAPVGYAYTRLMKRDGRITETRRKLLDEAMGGDGWRSLYRQHDMDMFGHAPEVRDEGWEAIASYFMGRWQEVFGPGALQMTLPLAGRGRLPLLLCFACSNRNPKAHGAALRIASSLIEKARDGRLI